MGERSYGISKDAVRRLWQQLQLDIEHAGLTDVMRCGLFEPGVVDTPGLRTHIDQARHCGLAHTDYLQGMLDSGSAYTPETAAEAITRLALDIDPETFSERPWRTAELIQDLAS